MEERSFEQVVGLALDKGLALERGLPLSLIEEEMRKKECLWKWISWIGSKVVS